MDEVAISVGFVRCDQSHPDSHDDSRVNPQALLPSPPLSLSTNTTAVNNRSESNSVDGEDSEGSGKGQEDNTSTYRPTWNGWAELENDPTIFSTLLREWGVRNVDVHEVIPLDAIFDASADSTYGMILLSRFVPPSGTDSNENAPPDLWFANQVSSFSCATVSLMNVINNREDINLSPDLSNFRDATKPLSSKDRGLALDTFRHVKNVHNSFASDFDMMNVDLRLKEDVAEAARKKKAAQSKKARKRRKVATEDEDDSGFHFVAYVPACGQVWRLDGMEAKPRSLGPLSDGDSWLAAVVPDLQAQWTSSDSNEMEFSLLRLVAGSNADDIAEDQTKAQRMRESWGPFIAGMVNLHAERGDIRESLAN